MKGMKLLPILAICVFAMGICGAVFLAKMQEDGNTESQRSEVKGQKAKGEAEDEDTAQEQANASSWVCPPIPKFLEKYFGKTDVYADTICVADGKAYYFGYDEHYRTNVIYTLDEVLCEEPSLTYDTLNSSSKTKFIVSTAHHSITVDFSDRKSIAHLADLMPEFGTTKRFCKDYHHDKLNALYHFEIDFPKQNNSLNDNIYKWLIWIVNESLDYGANTTSPNRLHESFKKIKYNAQEYRGDIRNVTALGRYASNAYFEHIRKYCDTDFPEGFPIAHSNLSLRLVSTNGKYYSYQKCTYDYAGGIHGYPTQEIRSFAPQQNEEIDWDYLFVDCSSEYILALFYKTVLADKKYQRWSDVRTVKEIKEIFERNSENMAYGNDLLPTPGLTDKGVTFSFQPYYLSCFAAGCFHFTIPYEDLKPYMTTKAKKLLNLK